MAERVAVNHQVIGSNPIQEAYKIILNTIIHQFILEKTKIKNQIQYNIIVFNNRTNKRGNKIDTIGKYILPTNSQSNKKIILDKTKLYSWLLKGAKPNKQVKKILKKAGILNV